jgi:hypothetical protein
MPSKQHIDLQHRAVAWLRSRATGRGLQSGMEISLRPGYVADVVAMLTFQYRFADRYHQLSMRPGSTVCQLQEESVCIFECKASRADFLSSFGPNPKQHVNRHEKAGVLHWVVASRGVVCAEDFLGLGFWGLLEESGRGLCEYKAPEPSSMTRAEINEVAYELPLAWYLSPRTRRCGRCRLPRTVAPPHLTHYSVHCRVWALCQDCWRDLRTPDRRLPYYERVVTKQWPLKWRAVKKAVMQGR